MIYNCKSKLTIILGKVFININTGEVINRLQAGNTSLLDNDDKELMKMLQTSEGQNWIPYELYVNLLLICLPLRIAPRVFDVFYYPHNTDNGEFDPVYYMAMELPSVNLSLKSYIDIIQQHHIGRNVRTFGPTSLKFPIYFTKLLELMKENITLRNISDSMLAIIRNVMILDNILGIFPKDFNFSNIVMGNFVDSNPDVLLIDFGAACPKENSNNTIDYHDVLSPPTWRVVFIDVCLSTNM